MHCTHSTGAVLCSQSPQLLEGVAGQAPGRGHGGAIRTQLQLLNQHQHILCPGGGGGGRYVTPSLLVGHCRLYNMLLR